MSAKKAVVAWLKADSDVTALISGRVYPKSALQGVARPYVVYSRISGTVSEGLDGPLGEAHEQIQLDCVADKELDAETLALTICGTQASPKLDGYLGTIGGVRVTESTLLPDGRVDTYEPPVDGSERGAYTVSLAFLVSWISG